MGQPEAADLILRNASVLTMELSGLRAEAVAVRGGRIVAVGSDADIDGLRSERTRVIDCQGGAVTPGFHDAHLHIFSIISSLMSVDCSPAAVSSIADIQRRIAEKASRTIAGMWVKGSEYNKFYLEEKRHPSRWDLDKAAPAHPVKLAHRTRHACVLNSRGLALAGINAETPDPPGGLIDREPETGEPTGLLFGMNAWLSRHVVPPLTDEELNQGAARASEMLLSVGVTSFQDATVHNDRTQWELIKKLKGSGVMKPGAAMMFGFKSLGWLRENRTGREDGPWSGAVKFAVDEISGSLNPRQEELNEMVLAAHREGFQVAIHAIEDTTVEAAVTAIEYALQILPGAGHRHRIEHCSECPDRLLDRIRKAGILVVTQPAFIFHNGERYLQEVEPHRQPWLYRIGSWCRAGVRVAASSDAPVIPVDPLTGIYAAATRTAANGQLVLPEEKVTSEEALRMYTLAGAYTMFREDETGSIVPGKWADLVVLNEDPTAIPETQIRDIRVEKTIVNGEVVWQRA